jgi:hypothetical protein
VRTPALLLVALLTLSGCATGGSDNSGPDQVPESATADPSVLPTGRTPLVLTPGSHYSPVGFVPALALTVPAGWSSNRRGDDAFDLLRPGLTVVFDTPREDSAAAALAAARASVQGGRVTPARGTLVGEPATGFDLVGGTGVLLTSPSGTVRLTAAPGQHLQLLGADVDQVPLLVAVVVPDGARWTALQPAAQQLVSSVTPG